MFIADSIQKRGANVRAVLDSIIDLQIIDVFQRPI